jgi:hypothetical protein
MDADVMITMAFSFEVFLFALAAGPYIVHEVRKSRSEAAIETRRERLDLARICPQPRPSASRTLRAADTAQPEPATARVRGGRGVLP